ncbi:STAS domain-containing protein [Streptomyces sp. NPDC046915]|uniref:STAS domain-containing protein n=1 Tax=Streptomyces sp. NPDC046915 TaxID=3155257 RepID=UPI0033ED98A8
MTLLPTPRDPRGLPGRTLITLPPEIDLSNADVLLDHVLSVSHSRADRLRVLVLDLTRTAFLDSQGARLIHDIRRRLPPHTEVRVVAHPWELPGRVLELTGVRRDVPVYDDLVDALTARYP